MNTTANFKITILVAAAALFIAAHAQTGKPDICTLKLHNIEGRTVRLNVEIADTESEREKGLMFRTSMPQDSGMLFVFEKSRKLSFWMKNTYIPLDIAFIDSNGIITDIYQMVPLDTSVFYNSSREVRYALEANEWWFSKNGINVGSKIGLNGCIGK